VPLQKTLHGAPPDGRSTTPWPQPDKLGNLHEFIYVLDFKHSRSVVPSLWVEAKGHAMVSCARRTLGRRRIVAGEVSWLCCVSMRTR
jgi:hypothetical protein